MPEIDESSNDDGEERMHEDPPILVDRALRLTPQARSSSSRSLPSSLPRFELCSRNNGQV